MGVTQKVSPVQPHIMIKIATHNDKDSISQYQIPKHKLQLTSDNTINCRNNIMLCKNMQGWDTMVMQ